MFVRGVGRLRRMRGVRGLAPGASVLRTLRRRRGPPHVRFKQPPDDERDPSTQQKRSRPAM